MAVSAEGVDDGMEAPVKLTQQDFRKLMKAIF
jgi:hypothetical protein